MCICAAGRAAVQALEARMLLSAAALPRPDHVVVVVEEDHSYSQILGDTSASMNQWFVVPPDPFQQDPYLRGLASNGASMTNAHSVGDTNQTDYQALISGLSPQQFPDHPLNNPNVPNLASELIAAGLTFGGYSESMPSAGFTGGDSGLYKRGHNPWVDLHNIPQADNLPFSSFPRDYSKLPTVSFVVPNLYDDMHSGPVSQADQWLADNISGYAKWAMHHNSLLIVTWDESHQTGNSIPTIFFGPMVETGNYTEPMTQWNVLRTLEDMYGLSPTNQAATVSPITDVFNVGGLSAGGEDAAIKFERQFRHAHHREKGSISGLLLQTAMTHRGPKAHPAANWRIYLDLAGTGTYELGDPNVSSNRHGRFTFKNLPAGTYTIRVIPQAGLNASSPVLGYYQVSLAQGAHARGFVFSEQPIS